MKKPDLMTVLSLAGMALIYIGNQLRDHVQEKQMEKTIEEKVNEAIARRGN